MPCVSAFPAESMPLAGRVLHCVQRSVFPSRRLQVPQETHHDSCECKAGFCRVHLWPWRAQGRRIVADSGLEAKPFARLTRELPVTPSRRGGLSGGVIGGPAPKGEAQPTVVTGVWARKFAWRNELRVVREWRRGHSCDGPRRPTLSSSLHM